TLSYYNRFKLFDLLPVEGSVRLHPQYVFYQRSGTARRFRLPEASPIYGGRVGIRAGGEPPELFPDVALGVSVWYEVSWGQEAGAYGFPEPPTQAQPPPQQAWARAGGIFNVTKNQNVRLFLTGGTSRDTDPLSSYRLGSSLPFRREFPLVLHGYFVDEIFAHHFLLVDASHRFSLWPGSKRGRLPLALHYAPPGDLAGHRLPP